MADNHLTRELLEAVARGEISVEQLLRRAARHLVEICPECRAEHLAFVQRRRRPTMPEAEPMLETVKQWRRSLDDLHRQARRDFTEITRLVPEERRPRVDRARKRFRNPLLAELLLEEARRRVFDAPREAYELAQLAEDVALRLNVGSFGLELPFELVLRANAHKANALRSLGDVRAAEPLMARPLRKLEEVADPLARAEIASLAASLRRDQRRFAEALDLLQQALEIYREARDNQRVGRILVEKGEVLREAAEPDRALEAVRSALDVINPETEKRLYLCARHNLATCLSEIGRFDQARQVLEAGRTLYDEFDDGWTHLRRSWLEAKIARGLGEHAAAESLYLTVRDGFAERGMGYDAARVSLELALLYCEQGRSSETKRLAREMVPLFQAQDIHREALAALMIFQEAAQREAVSVGLLKRLESYLSRARRDRSLKFRE